MPAICGQKPDNGHQMPWNLLFPHHQSCMQLQWSLLANDLTVLWSAMILQMTRWICQPNSRSQARAVWQNSLKALAIKRTCSEDIRSCPTADAHSSPAFASVRVADGHCCRMKPIAMAAAMLSPHPTLSLTSTYRSPGPLVTGHCIIKQNQERHANRPVLTSHLGEKLCMERRNKTDGARFLRPPPPPSLSDRNIA